MKEEKTEIALADNERQACEVWTRVMGYHRPISAYNIGKKGEAAERLYFSEHPKGIKREHKKPSL